MKHKSPLFLAVALALTLTACTATPANPASTTENPIILTTIFPPYDFTREIAADLAEVQMLLQPGADTHSFEPSPQQILVIQSADLFIYTGGESDSWIDAILASMGDKAPQTLRMIDAVEAVEEEIVEGMEHDDHDEHDHDHDDHDDHDHDHDHDHDEPADLDEHVWTSPVNAALISTAICASLAVLDPENADTYAENLTAYLTELSRLDEDIRAAVAGASRDTLLFGDKFAFRYLADAYGLAYYAAFPGCSSETDASAATIAFLIDKAKAEQIPVILKQELTSDKMAVTIAEAAGAEVLVLHSCHNLTREELESGATYLSLMRGNIEVLAKALA